VGPRGSGKFEPISWDEALDTIAEKLSGIKAKYGPEAVIFYAGYSKFYRPFFKRLAHSFGSPNYLTESSTCAMATEMAQRLVFGTASKPDIPNTQCLLVWSSNPFYSRPSDARSILQGKGRGMKLLVVDPRETPTASRADIHLQVRPGTDGALALAMAHVIIEEQLYDQEFIATQTYGFEEYKEYVREFTPERGETLTGVPANKIREAARMYASSKPAAIMPSASPVVHHTNGVQNYRAIFALVGLTGNYDIKGGNFVDPQSFLKVPGFDSNQQKFAQSRPYSEMAPRLGADKFPVWIDVGIEEGQAMQLPYQIRSGKPYPIKAMFSLGLNYRMWPDSEGFLDSLSELDFFANADIFMTDSCKYADIVLPACTSVERSDLRCYPSGYILYTQPAITPLFESRSDYDIIYALAEKLGLDDPLLKAGYETSLNYILEPSGITVEELKKHPAGMSIPTQAKPPERKYLSKGFTTKSGKLEFKSKTLERYEERTGFESCPVYHPPKYSPDATPEIAQEYPFILNTGSRLPMFIHTRTFRLTWTSSLRPQDPAADINPADAARLGIKQNDTIRLSSPKTSIIVKANLTQMAQPGVVHMFHGYPQADVAQLFEGNYLDPLSGFPGFKSALCKIEKA
jgi:anaerobic selenocysteine-containing dehydrogenase